MCYQRELDKDKYAIGSVSYDVASESEITPCPHRRHCVVVLEIHVLFEHWFKFETKFAKKSGLLSHLMAYTLSVERISVRDETYKSSSRSETFNNSELW